MLQYMYGALYLFNTTTTNTAILQPLYGEVLAWLSVWSKVQMICIWSCCCYCHPIISCSTKMQNDLPFW